MNADVNASAAIASSKLAATEIHLFIPHNSKLADITHADTNKHTLDLATALSETRDIVAVQIYGLRQTGSGNFLVYPNEGTYYTYAGHGFYYTFMAILADGENRLQYALDVASDDWDLYCMGYVVKA